MATLRWRSWSPRFFAMPVEEDVEAFALELASLVADLAGIAQQEVERRARHGTLAGVGFEAAVLAAAAGFHDGAVGFGELEIRRVPVEGVAARLAREQVVQVTAHRLAFGEPGLRHDVLAVEGSCA